MKRKEILNNTGNFFFFLKANQASLKKKKKTKTKALESTVQKHLPDHIHKLIRYG